MNSTRCMPLSKLIKEFSLEEIYLPTSAEEISICSTEVNRPGLILSGFTDMFEPFRIQIIGKVEDKFLLFFCESQGYVHSGAEQPKACRGDL